MLLVSAN